MTAEQHGYWRIANIALNALDAHRKPAMLIFLLGLISTAAQLLGLLSLIPILKHAASGTIVSDALPRWLPAFFSDRTVLSLLVFLASLLLFLSVLFKHLAQKRAHQTAAVYATACAEQCVMRLVDSQHSAQVSVENGPTAKLNQVIPAAPNACAILFVNALQASNEVFLMILFLAALLFLAPIFAITALVLAIPFIVVFGRNIRTNTNLALQRKDAREQLQSEKKALNQLVLGADIEDPGLPERIRSLTTHGVLGDSLVAGLEYRHRIRAASFVIEQIGPMSIIVFGIFLLNAEALGLDLVQLFVAFLLLRQCVVSLTALASGMAVVNRVYPGLREYLALQTTGEDAHND